MLFAAINNLSEHNFVAPYKLTGAAALSVDKATTFLTPEVMKIGPDGAASLLGTRV